MFGIYIVISAKNLILHCKKYQMVIPNIIQIQNWNKQLQVNETLVTNFHIFRLNRLNRVTVRLLPPIGSFRWPFNQTSTGSVEFTPGNGFSHGPAATGRNSQRVYRKIATGREHILESWKSLWRVGGDQVPFQEYSIRFADVIPTNGPFGPCCQRLSIIGKFLAPVCATLLHLVPVFIDRSSRARFFCRKDTRLLVENVGFRLIFLETGVGRAKTVEQIGIIGDGFIDEAPSFQFDTEFVRTTGFSFAFSAETMNLLNRPLLFKAPRAIVSDGDRVEYALRV